MSVSPHDFGLIVAMTVGWLNRRLREERRLYDTVDAETEGRLADPREFREALDALSGEIDVDPARATLAMLHDACAMQLKGDRP